MRWAFGVVLLAAIGVAGCKPAIGDGCSTSTDCSLNGSRICDTAQPGGYCTIRGCDPDGCPEGAVCVEWRYEPSRTAATWCMKRCSSNDGCRGGRGYRCVGTNELGQLVDRDGVPVGLGDAGVPDAGVPDAGVPGAFTARVIDARHPDRRFCAAVDAD